MGSALIPWSERQTFPRPVVLPRAIANPGKVSCVYGENPVLHSFMSKALLLENFKSLATAKVPLVHVCGQLDPALEEQTRAMEKRYQELGGKITVIVQEGSGHYPLSPRDPASVVGHRGIGGVSGGIRSSDLTVAGTGRRSGTLGPLRGQ